MLGGHRPVVIKPAGLFRKHVVTLELRNFCCCCYCSLCLSRVIEL